MEAGDRTDSSGDPRARYQVARDLARKGEGSAAREVLEALLAEEPGPASAKARMLLADLHLAERDFPAAQALLAAECQSLLGDERRREIAALYLERVDAALEEERPELGLGEGPDREKALQLLDALAVMDLPLDLDRQIRIRRAEVARAEEDYPRSLAAYRDYLEHHDPLYGVEILGRLPGSVSPEAAGPELVAARLGLLEVELLRVGALEDPSPHPDPDDEDAPLPTAHEVGDWALTLLESTLAHLRAEDFPAGVETSPEQLRRLTYLRPLAAGLACEFRSEGEGSRSPTSARRAVDHAREYLSTHPDGPEALELHRLLPRALFTAGFRDEALAHLDRFLDHPPEFEGDRGRARLASSLDQARFARGLLRLAGGDWARAREAFQDYLARCPDGAHWQEAQEQVHGTAISQGYQALQELDFEAARHHWGEVLSRRGLHETSPWLALAIAQCWELEARRVRDHEEKPRKARELFRRAAEELAAVARRYPGEIQDQARYARAEILREELGELQEAVAEYRRSGDPRAEVVLSELEEVELRLEVPRVFGTDEEAAFELHTRNVESLTVRRYPIDLADFFAKYHTSEEVGRLDLDLVQPEATWEVQVPGYQPFQDFEQTVPLGVEGPGAHAVRVESPEHEATVLVLVSDLEVLVASTREEALALVQDRSRQEGVPEASVELWGGPHPEQTLSATTGSDGVARARFGESPEEPPYAFARHGDHVAVAGIELPDSTVTRLAPRGQLQPSRPVYLPGEEIEVRGVLRGVGQGCYQIEEGALYRATLLSPGGQTLGEEEVRCNRFGTVLSRFQLPAAAPLGSYTVRLDRRRREGERLSGRERSYSTQFEVRYVTPSRLFLKLTPSAPALLAGDPLEVEFEAGFYTGAPLANRTLLVELPDGRKLRLETDERGRASTTLDTTPFFRHRELTLRAQVPGEDAAAELSIPLLPAALQLEVRDLGSRRNRGERLEGTILVQSPNGEPLPEHPVEVALYQRRSQRPPELSEDVLEGLGLDPGARVREDRCLHQATLVTDAEGRAPLSFPLEECGRLRVVVSSRDAAGRERSLTRRLEVEEPPTPELALECESAQLVVGDEAAVRVRYRDRPGLGLLVLTGEGILSYEVHGFQSGVRSHRFPVTAEHLPNMRLVALAPGKRALHRAEQEFFVRRRLTLSYQLPEGPLRPGTEVEVGLEARDESGRPVAADLSFRLLDRGLLEKVPDVTEDLVAFFETGARRSVALAAASSVGFSRTGRKQEISQEVLEEARRLRDVSLAREDADDMFECLAMDLPACEAEEPMPMPMSMPPPAFGAMQASVGGPPSPPCPSPAKAKSRKRVRRERGSGGGGPGAPEPSAAEREELTIGAVWLGRVETGDDGRGQARFTVPDRCSAYQVQVRGANAGDAFGQVEGEVVVRRYLQLHVRLPHHVFEGDQVRPLVRVECSSELTGPVEVELELSVGRRSRRFPASLELSGKGVSEVLVGPFEIPAGQTLVARAQVLQEGRALDSVRLERPVRPWGSEHRSGSSGTLEDSRTLRLDLPASVRPETAALELTFHSPQIESLLESASHWGPSWPGQDATAARLIAESLLVQSLAGIPDLEAERELRRDRCRDQVTALLSTQEASGGWSWIPASRGAGAPDATTTAWCLLALAEAREAGWLPEAAPLERAAAYLESQGIDFEEDGERGPLAALALARAGSFDFSRANRLFRRRGNLTRSGQAQLGLALVALDRREHAGEIADELAQLWDGDPIGVLAPQLLLRALLGRRDGTSQAQGERLRSLLAASWWQGVETWCARAALAAAAESGTREEADVSLSVRIGGRELASYVQSGRLPSQTFTWSHEDLGPLPLEVEVRYQGRGAVGYRARLTGFSPTLEARRELSGPTPYRERFYHSAPLYKGRRLLASSMRVEQTAFDDHVEYYLSMASRDEGIDPGPYTVLETWVPGGVMVDETQLPSSALSVRQDRGRLTMVFRGRPPSFRVPLLTHCPGSYRVPGATLSSATCPEAYDRLGQERPLLVLAPGEEDRTSYQWTESERVAFGLAHFRDHEPDQALAHLTELSPERVRKEAEVIRALLWIRCLPRFYRASEVVELFELLEQRSPGLTLPYEKLLVVGQAYHDSGEDEAACQLWRATMASCYRDAVPVAAELEAAGEYLKAADYLEELYWRFPDLPVVVRGLYALGQDVHAHRLDREATKDTPPHRITQRAAGLFGEFLKLHPDQPYADQVTFSLLSALRELGAHELTIEQAAGAARNYPESPFRDRFHFLRALGAFYLGRYQEAMEAARAVAEQGGDDAATAVYLLGQMHQALGESAEALERYREVEFDFPDASHSIRYLERRRLSMPEVVTSSVGDPVEVPLRHVGAEEVEVLAYKVDLMRLFLKESNLDRVSGVDLAGITPTCTFTRELPPAPAGTTAETRIALPFEEVGAYLVLARSRDAFASGLALVTPLHLETMRHPDGVRVTVLEGEERRPAREVHVKISDGGGFRAGETDLRGVCTLSTHGPELTVVARRGTHEYAFHRSRPGAPRDQPSPLGGAGRTAYDSGLLAAGEELRMQASQELREQFQRRGSEQQGVPVAEVRR